MTNRERKYHLMKRISKAGSYFTAGYPFETFNAVLPRSPDLTMLSLEKLVLLLEPPAPKSLIFGCSKSFKGKLIDRFKSSQQVDIYGIPVIESSLFPFEIKYDACDVATRELIQIPSDELCHGVMFADPIPASYDAPRLQSWIYDEPRFPWYPRY